MSFKASANGDLKKGANPKLTIYPHLVLPHEKDSFGIFEHTSEKFTFISPRVLGVVVGNDTKHPKNFCIYHSLDHKKPH